LNLLKQAVGCTGVTASRRAALYGRGRRSRNNSCSETYATEFRVRGVK